ncbi:MAG: hypothetical protein B7Z30_11030 [Rhizobiales bacterium 12-68-15]|nr:MAG: hypothetical protein B7Z30_11030 [Rhizobiales bacterium 12-68-15]
MARRSRWCRSGMRPLRFPARSSSTSSRTASAACLPTFQTTPRKRGTDMTFEMSRRGFLASVSSAAGLALLPRGAFAADELVAATFGGTWANVQKQILAPYFTKRTGASVVQSPMLATEQIAKLTAAKGNQPPFDVAMLDEGPALEAIDAGLIAKYDPAKSPNFAALNPQFQGAYGPAITMQAIGIAYNPKTVKTPPTSWEDLWKPEYKGRVGITSLASTLGLAFLLDINRLAGGTEANMEPGFKLKPDLAYAYVDSQISPDVQGEMQKSPWNVIPTSSKVPYGGLVAEKIAKSPADLDKMVFFDWKVVNQNRAAWTQQFNRDIRV